MCEDPEARPGPCVVTDVDTRGLVPSVTVETWTLAKRRRLLDRWSVPIVPDPQDGEGDALTLRDLITRIVHREVAAFERREHARQFVRVLSEREISGEPPVEERTLEDVQRATRSTWIRR